MIFNHLYKQNTKDEPNREKKIITWDYASCITHNTWCVVPSDFMLLWRLSKLNEMSFKDDYKTEIIKFLWKYFLKVVSNHEQTSPRPSNCNKSKYPMTWPPATLSSLNSIQFVRWFVRVVIHKRKYMLNFKWSMLHIHTFPWC